MAFESFPYVISSNYAAIEEEERPSDRFRQVLRTFAATLKFLSLVALAEYLNRPEHFNREVDAFLADPCKLRRPSLGHFLDLLRNVLNGADAWIAESTLCEMAGIWRNQKSRVRLLDHLMGRLIHLRNLYVHSDIVPTDAEALDLVQASQKDLDALLETVDWLANGRLWIVSPDGRCSIARLKVVASEEPVLPRLSDVWWEYRTARIPLPPFLITKFQDADPRSVDSVLQYETLSGLKIKYLFGKQALFVDQQEVLDALRGVMASAQERILSPLTSGKDIDRGTKGLEIDWETVAGSAANHTERLILTHASLGKYLRGTYVRRPALHGPIHEFIQSDRRLLVLVGESGFGKTNLMCHMAQELVAENHVVLLYSGRFYQGEAILDLIGRAFGWPSSEVLANLSRWDGIEPAASGKRLVILFDAINEYAYPQSLFDALYGLIAHPHCPQILRVLVATRPLAWESIEAGFVPDRNLVFCPTPAAERANEDPHMTIGPFSDEELNEALEKWRAFAGMDQEIGVDADLRGLLRQPILFRFYVDLMDRESAGMPACTAPASAETLLIERIHRLDAPTQHRVESVVSAMWRRGKDWLGSSEYLSDPELEPWITSDQGDYALAIFGCEEEGHRQIAGRVIEYDERQLTRIKACPVCGQPLIKIREKWVKRPLDQLREEGILSLSLLPDGEEALRFTYDRLHETLTGRYVLALVGPHDSRRAQTLARFVEDSAGLEKATLNMALQTALLLGMHEHPEDTSTLMLALGKEPASPALNQFLYAVLIRWAERDFRAAWSCCREMVSQGWSGYGSHLAPCSGLLAGIAGLARLLADGESLDAKEVEKGMQQLVEIALHPLALIGGEGNSSLDAAPPVFGGQGVGDLCLGHLQDFCQDQALAGVTGTNSVLQLVGYILECIAGPSKVWRHRTRLRSVVNWLIRLVSLQVRNERLTQGVVAALRPFLSKFPLIKPTTGKTRRLLRATALHLVSIPTLRIADARIASQVTGIPPTQRRFPNDPPPTLTKMLHLTRELAPNFKRLVHLLENLDEHVTDQDVDALKAFERLCFDEPFRGVLAACEGNTLSTRSMHSFEEFLPIAEKFVTRLAENEEFPGNDLVWGLLYRGERLPDDLYDRLFNLVWTAISRTRNRMINRYEMSGQLAIWLCPIQLPDVYRDDGDMPGCRRFADEACRRKDWALLARFWDQFVFSGLQAPKRVLGYVERTIAFQRDMIEFLAGDRVISIRFDVLVSEASGMAGRRRPGHDLDVETRPDVVALLHLLGTVGTLEIAFPREVASFYRKADASADVISLIRALASVDTLRKLRDEKMLSYFFNYCTLEFPSLRQYLVDMWQMVIADAESRHHVEPRRKDLVRLLSRLIDRGLDLISDEKTAQKVNIP